MSDNRLVADWFHHYSDSIYTFLVPGVKKFPFMTGGKK